MRPLYHEQRPERFPCRGRGTAKPSPGDLHILARAQQTGLVDARAMVVVRGVPLFLELEEEASSLSHIRIPRREIHQRAPLRLGLGWRCSRIVAQHLCALLHRVRRRRDVRVAPRPTNMGLGVLGSRPENVFDGQRCDVVEKVKPASRPGGSLCSVGGAPSWGVLLEPSRVLQYLLHLVALQAEIVTFSELLQER
jgi:hypothetical protein